MAKRYCASLTAVRVSDGVCCFLYGWESTKNWISRYSREYIDMINRRHPGEYTDFNVNYTEL